MKAINAKEIVSNQVKENNTFKPDISIKRYYVCFIKGLIESPGYFVLDNENHQKIVFKGKEPDGTDAKQWAQEENHKLLTETL
jgi:hypothetical protein